MEYFYLKIDKLELFQPLNRDRVYDKRIYLSNKMYRVASVTQPEYDGNSRTIYINGSNQSFSFIFLKIKDGEKYLQAIKS